MGKSIRKVAVILILLLVVVFALILFIPRKYEVPAYMERANTRYWHLRTGSKIGYTVLPGKGIVKPTPVIFLHGVPEAKLPIVIFRILLIYQMTGLQFIYTTRQEVEVLQDLKTWMIIRLPGIWQI